ncbi:MULTISPECIES: D-ribose pyranase [Priestia]|jgi:D-ribose pyranase|uniref:D-ribose pyranase n=1 Tax=Priestia megaterium TaxID=1404 RepID=A0A3D8X3H9_PRIMG|nr:MULTISPECIES: D-ribose pyranase [Priestia]MBK0006988.1 D-ribose pyranase [Bacillus sp. S35]SDC97567.1 ribose transport protein RbsD [Priestia aryabhattai B8W22]MCM3640803.1 D-ribose pyranase [Priestia aryabhattai]MDH3173822.1 D-ribose pyranase [Priestia megaterium]PFW80224.1 D-ribose pyranase [Priestia aryabhattai]
MKRHGMINSHITKILTDLGHTDTIVIADAGLPVPSDVLKIDLSLKLGVPSFEDVVVAVLEDMATEKIVIASEMKERNQKAYELMEKQNILVEEVSHEQLKMLTSKAKVVIRTGEATPYANCILQAGVIF